MISGPAYCGKKKSLLPERHALRNKPIRLSVVLFLWFSLCLAFLVRLSCYDVPSSLLLCFFVQVVLEASRAYSFLGNGVCYHIDSCLRVLHG